MANDITLLVSKKNALLLGAFACVCTTVVAITYVLTAPTIAKQEQLQTLKKITQVLDVNKFDNNPLENCVFVSKPELTGSDEKMPIYRATFNDQPYALIYQTQTTKGYNGLIKLIAATDVNGKVQGVRTLNHKETPGLGDKIELEKSDWVLSFNNKEVRTIDDAKWFVKKDGGDFDQFTGATITPRAVVNQIRTASFNVTAQFNTLFELPNECNVNQSSELNAETAVSSTSTTTDSVSETSTDVNNTEDDEVNND